MRCGIIGKPVGKLDIVSRHARYHFSTFSEKPHPSSHG